MGDFVTPQAVRLSLSEGRWLLVKKRLSYGEQSDAYARIYVAGADGSLKANPLMIGLAMMSAYLLDWNLTDDDGKPVPIRGLSTDDLIAVLRSADPDTVAEVRQAIEAHEDRVTKAREEEKKTRSGGNASAAISPSPDAAAGASSGSVPSTLMSTVN